MLGRGCRLARVPASGEARLGGDDGRLDDGRFLVLLSTVHGRPVSPSLVERARRAAGHWRRGDKALAHIELAFARLPRLEDEEDAFRLFMAEALLDDGMSPSDLACGLGFAALGAALGKYDPDQPRNPAGSGPESGRWTKGPVATDAATASTLAVASVRALRPAAPSLAEALGTEALAWLTRLAGRLALPAALFGAAFVPSPNGGAAEQGTVPDHPGLRYWLDRDTGTLRLADAGDPDPTRALVARLGVDGVYRDVDTGVAVARALGDRVVLIDLDRAPATAGEATAEDEGPKLCPAPKADRAGGRRLFDVLYEQYVRDAVNPQRRPQLSAGLTFALPGDVPSGWVHYDDCREADGTMIEAKGNYAGFLASSFGKGELTKEWLDQADRQVRAAGNRRVEWYFHDPEAATFAKKLFADNDLGSIGIHVLPYPGGVPKPNPRIR